MTKYKLEYIWLDGYTPVPNLRGKTQIKEFDAFPTLEQLPLWGFDGSSTMQAEGHCSDCVLKPVAVYPGSGPHQRRARYVRSHDAGRRHAARLQQARHDPRRRGRLVRLRAGIFLLQGRPPARLPESPAIPAPQGPYYTGVGYKNVGDIARQIVEEHLDLCLAAGINHEGINAEVAKGQWEFQIFGKGSKKAADQIWMARYLLLRLLRKIRHRHRVPLQAARRYRLERLGHALQLLDQVHARGRRQGVFRGADGGLRQEPARPHRRLWP